MPGKARQAVAGERHARALALGDRGPRRTGNPDVCQGGILWICSKKLNPFIAIGDDFGNPLRLAPAIRSFFHDIFLSMRECSIALGYH